MPRRARTCTARSPNIASLGATAAVALNPSTPATAVEHVLDLVDMVLVMTVNPGFGGQSYIATMEPKIAEVRAMIDAAGLDGSVDVEVDGGIGPETIAGAVAAGANVLVAGSALYRDPHGLAHAVADLRRLGHRCRHLTGAVLRPTSDRRRGAGARAAPRRLDRRRRVARLARRRTITKISNLSGCQHDEDREGDRERLDDGPQQSTLGRRQRREHAVLDLVPSTISVRTGSSMRGHSTFFSLRPITALPPNSGAGVARSRSAGRAPDPGIAPTMYCWPCAGSGCRCRSGCRPAAHPVAVGAPARTCSTS